MLFKLYFAARSVYSMTLHVFLRGMLTVFCCLDGESVLLKTLDYFVRSSARFSVDSSVIQMTGSDVFSPREREQLNRFISSSLLSHRLIFVILYTLYLLATYGAMF